MLICKTGLNAPVDFLEQVYAVDKQVYPPSLCGELHNLVIRYERCPDTYLLLYDGETLAGYLCFLPLGDALYAQMTDPADHAMRDDDIAPAEMESWRKGEFNHLFILSVALLPAYRGGEAIRLLGDSFLQFLREKEAAGYPIGSLCGSAISDGGANFLKRFGGVFQKEVDGGYRYHLADRKRIEDVLQHGLLL
ncbi:MAG: hypothetical protein IJO76_07730 [Clostridia bacterium]|nr:hypothetical protein [Clostridia bacterium]